MEGLRIEDKGGTLLVAWSGEMTLDTTAGLRSGIDAAMGGKDFRCLVMDLSDVGFMDSSGIGLLVSLSSRVESGERSFYLYRPSTQVARTLDLVRLRKYFKILSTEDELAPLML